METEAIVQTASAKRYLGQFCKHFAHKLPVDYAETYETGEVTFGTGLCKLQANETTLKLKVKALTAEDAARLQDVVERHMIRFSFREPLVLQWNAAA